MSGPPVAPTPARAVRRTPARAGGPPRRAAARLRVLLLAAALAACATRGTAPSPGDHAIPACTPSLAFLDPGVTTRAEALARLGAPSSTWDSGRVLVWAVLRDPQGALHIAWSEGSAPLPRSHDLVLAFGAEERLERHALVPRDEE